MTERTDEHRPEMRGDEAALYARYAQQLRRIVRCAVTGSPEMIEDACAYAWEQFIRRQPERSYPVAWLKVTAIRYAIDERQRARREVALEDVRDSDDWRDPATTVVEETAEAREALAKVAALPERRRRVFALRLAGYSYQEIMERCGLTYTAVNRELVKARHRLSDKPGRDWRH